MFKLGSLAKKYNLTEKDFESIYYSTINMVRRVNGKVNEDLFVKYMYDKLEEEGLTYRDTEKVVNFFAEELQERQAKKDKKAIDRIMEGDDPLEVVEEETQTSSNTGIDAAIGRNKKAGYTTEVDNMYEDDENKEDEDDYYYPHGD